MGGRGRGRGGAGRGLSFNLDSLGIGRGEGVPTAIYQPPPLYPPLQYKAIPLEVGGEYSYMLALKQEFRGSAQESSHFVKAAVKKRDIERYSDKYKLAQAGDEFRPDWTRLPQELKPLKKRKKVLKADASGGGGAARKKRKLADVATLDAIKDLDKTDEQQSEDEEAADANESKKKKEAEEEGDDEDEEEEYEDEEVEEENDYVAEYFDNGEGYGDDDDDNVDEGATY